MVLSAIDSIFYLFSLLFDTIISNWVFGSVFLVSVLGIIAQLYANARNK